jgi:hypothetical protein
VGCTIFLPFFPGIGFAPVGPCRRFAAYRIAGTPRAGHRPAARSRYLTAAILSRIPGAQDFASSEARYTFCA